MAFFELDELDKERNVWHEIAVAKSKAFGLRQLLELNPKGEVELDRTCFRLPFADNCVGCRIGGNLGQLRYPWIDPKVVCSLAYLRKIENSRIPHVKWEEWVKLVAPFREALSAEWPISPCTGFGLLKGKGFGKLEDFEMCSPSILLAKRSVAARMRADGFEFTEYAVELKTRKPLEDPYVEIWTPPVATRPSQKEFCPHCFRADGKLGNLLEAPAKYSKFPTICARYLTFSTTATESLIEWAKQNKCTGLTWYPDELEIAWI